MTEQAGRLRGAGKSPPIMAAMTALLPPDIQVIERGWLSANLIVASGRVPTVIDSGYATHATQTLELVQAALPGAGPAQLINTHLHSDHCGGNAALQAAYPQLRTRIPPGLAHAVRTWDEDALSYRPTGQQCPRFGFDALLPPGQAVDIGDRPWQVHAAPGHDPHSVILFEPDSRTLISADALWENGFGVVFPELEGEQAFSEVGATLDVIEALQPATVIPGHGPVFAYQPAVMARARERLQGFVQDRRRHAQHAGKVLLKFKLLEVQQQALTDFMAWACGTHYLPLVQQRFFPEQTCAPWVSQLLEDLARAGAVELAPPWVRNR